MATPIPAEFEPLINDAYYAWFTSVRSDGMPQPTPVWFIREGDTFLVYAGKGTHKLNNIISNAKVALSFAVGDDAESFVVIMGEARIDNGTPAPVDNAPFLEKYRSGISDINMSLEEYNDVFNVPVRITPVHVRGQIDG